VDGGKAPVESSAAAARQKNAPKKRYVCINRGIYWPTPDGSGDVLRGY
jgi:hypothetical protein